MRITFVLNHVNLNGGLRVIAIYAERLKKRGHTVTVLYAARPVRGEAKGADDAAEARWFTRKEIGRLAFAFDHGEIIRAQLARRRAARPSRRARRGASRG